MNGYATFHLVTFSDSQTALLRRVHAEVGGDSRERKGLPTSFDGGATHQQRNGVGSDPQEWLTT